MAEDDRQSFTRDSTGVTVYNPDIPGGAKIYIRAPKRASVDSRGRINIVTRRPRDRTSERIAQSHHSSENSEMPETPFAAAPIAQSRGVRPLTMTKLRSPGGTLGYGLEDMDAAKGSGRASPFLRPEDEMPDLNSLLRHGQRSNQKA